MCLHVTRICTAEDTGYCASIFTRMCCVDSQTIGHPFAAHSSFWLSVSGSDITDILQMYKPYLPAKLGGLDKGFQQQDTTTLVVCIQPSSQVQKLTLVRLALWCSNSSLPPSTKGKFLQVMPPATMSHN